MKGRKKVFLLAICVATFFTAVPTMAEKKYFDFTVTAGKAGHTAQASKADNEQNSYITVTNFTKDGAMILFADKRSIYGVQSEAVFYNEANRAAYINKAQKRPYRDGTAKAGPGYWLRYDNYGNRTCWIKGRYNP